MDETAPERAKRKTDYGVSAEQFLDAWQASGSAQEAADRLGIPKSIAQARASKYRKAGIKVKRMPRRNIRDLDVDALNRRIEAGRALEPQAGAGGAEPSGTVEAKQAILFNCPSCETRTWVKEDWVERGGKDHLEPVPGDRFACGQCGYELTELERRPASDGGSLCFGWWWLCSCQSVNYTDTTIYRLVPGMERCCESPPSKARCSCGKAFLLEVADRPWRRGREALSRGRPTEGLLPLQATVPTPRPEDTT